MFRSELPIHSLSPVQFSFGANMAPASSRPNAFCILGVNCDSTDDDVKAQWRKLALEFHPDKGGDREKMEQLIYAKQELLLPDGRVRELNRTRPAAPDTVVQIRGLSTHPQLNGKHGIAGKWNGLRLEVHMTDGTKTVRPEKVLALPHGTLKYINT